MSTNKRTAQVSKPVFNSNAALAFATGAQQPSEPVSSNDPRQDQRQTPEMASASGKTLSGQIPGGDTRLTANIRKDLHTKLKIEAARRGTTIGEIIEGWIDAM